MHILLIHQVFVRPQDPGGTRHYEFAQQLVRRGHRVTVLAGTRSYLTGGMLGTERRQTLEPGLDVIRSWVYGGDGRGALGRMLAFASFVASAFLDGLRIPAVSLIWGTSPPLSQAWTAWALARLKRVPWLLEVRDLWPAFAVQVGVLRNRALIGLARGLERFLYRRADRIVLNSPGFISHLVDSGAEASKLAFVPNGVDTQLFDPGAQGGELRRLEGLEHKFIALYAGAHGLANDLWQLLAAAELLREDPRIAFVLVGDGREKVALQAKGRALGLSNVVFLPAIEKARIPALLADADCGLVVLKPIPLFTTTYPNKMFDYMAAAKPVVLAIDGVARRLVEEADAGVCVPPGDSPALAAALQLLAGDPGLAR
ncbi:MAG TPA: glycosyltransferase family 4 protein, partial [Dehalococcoidia bacterium]|nr:glycosyltransferase family 4 protein [Dehalococcoidia bacterium]